MSVATRAKFRVWSVEPATLDGKTDNVRVILGAVTDTSDENKVFWRATPAAHLQMTITNPDAFDAFESGKEYYVDFTPAG